VDGETSGAAEAEDQEHFDGPGADARTADEAFSNEFFVGESLGLLERGAMPSMVFCARSFMARIFAAGETAFPEEGLSPALAFLRRGARACGA